MRRDQSAGHMHIKTVACAPITLGRWHKACLRNGRHASGDDSQAHGEFAIFVIVIIAHRTK
jgi:hypothetical protein